MASASLSDYPTAPPSTAEVIGEDDMQQQDPGKSDGNGSQPQCEALKEYQMESRREREARRLFLRCNASMGSTLIWEHCCQEVQQDLNALDLLLAAGGLPSSAYSKEKSFTITDYVSAPDLKTCPAKDFLDFYIFPYLLPAIYSLLLYARENHIFQCRVCTFNPLDFIAENLYNYNPWHPDRNENPIPLFHAPFARRWLEKNPRPALPRWLTMSKEEAALIIQRVFRGFLVRKLPDVQEIRQFWIEYKKDKNSTCPSESLSYDEFDADYKQSTAETISFNLKTHSEQCILCAAFKCPVHPQPAKTTESGKLNEGAKLSIDRESIAAKYDACCFHPEGHLPFSRHKSQIIITANKSMTDTRFSCLLQKPCAVSSCKSRDMERQCRLIASENFQKSVEVLYAQENNKEKLQAPSRKFSLQNSMLKPSSQLLASET